MRLIRNWDPYMLIPISFGLNLAKAVDDKMSVSLMNHDQLDVSL